MERMTDYRPQERQDLEELYRKQNVRICELEEENKKLKEECEENDYLVEDNARWMKRCEEKIMEIKKLKEELEKLRTDNIYEEGLYD